MPRIVSCFSSLPRTCVPQREVRQAAAGIFAGKIPELDKALEVFDNSRIEGRRFIMPLEWYANGACGGEAARIYREQGGALAAAAARGCLERAGVAPDRIDAVVFVSSTGIATPTLDAYLVNDLGMSPSTRRLPVWGLGCAAGAAGLSRASDLCAASHSSLVLLVALETCSLTFLAGDASRKNLVAVSLFSDGAAAALVAGEGTELPGPRIAQTRSRLFPDTYSMMGWEVVEEGLQLVLSPRLPALVKKELPALVQEVRGEEPFCFYLTHPGGAKVIDAYREALGLSGEELLLTEETLRRHGNISSVSVLLVLERWLQGEGSHGGRGLLSAFGPGFSAEMLVLEDAS